MLAADQHRVVACCGPGAARRVSPGAVARQCQTQDVAKAASLLDQIEADVLDNRASLADALRKIVVLGGQTGSVELCEWAGHELRGYGNDDEIPDYRKITAPLKVNGFRGSFYFTGQTLSSSALPDFAREQINETLTLTQGIGEIEAMVARGTAKDGAVELAPSEGALLVRYMNSQSGAFEVLTELYWSVSVVTLAGVVDQVRTRLAELLAELRRATLPTATPTAEAATQAVNVVIHRRARVNLNTQQVASGGTVNAPAPTTAPQESGFWTRGRKVGAAVTGAVGVAATAIRAAVEAGWL